MKSKLVLFVIGIKLYTNYHVIHSGFIYFVPNPDGLSFDEQILICPEFGWSGNAGILMNHFLNFFELMLKNFKN